MVTIPDAASAFYCCFFLILIVGRIQRDASILDFPMAASMSSTTKGSATWTSSHCIQVCSYHQTLLQPRRGVPRAHSWCMHAAVPAAGCRGAMTVVSAAIVPHRFDEQVVWADCLDRFQAMASSFRRVQFPCVHCATVSERSRSRTSQCIVIDEHCVIQRHRLRNSSCVRKQNGGNS